MAANKDIEIYKGDTYVHELRLKDSSNVAINITSMSFKGAIKVSTQSSSNTASFEVSKTDASNGIVTFTISASNSANIRPGTYVYDFQQQNGAIVTTLLQGKVVVKSDVS